MIPGFDPRIMLAAPSGIVLPNPGDPWQGGFYVGLFTILSAGDIYALVVGSGASQDLKRGKTSQTSTANANDLIDGLANSNVMNDAFHPAAQYCRAYTGGGYNDWFLPAPMQMVMIYWLLKPTTDSNSIIFGKNDYALPPTNNYSWGVPTQTIVSSFKSGGNDAFDPYSYWTSNDAGSRFNVAFSWLSGNYGSINKTQSNRVRPVRQVRIA